MPRRKRAHQHSRACVCLPRMALNGQCTGEQPGALPTSLVAFSSSACFSALHPVTRVIDVMAGATAYMSTSQLAMSSRTFGAASDCADREGGGVVAVAVGSICTGQTVFQPHTGTLAHWHTGTHCVHKHTHDRCHPHPTTTTTTVGHTHIHTHTHTRQMQTSQTQLASLPASGMATVAVVLVTLPSANVVVVDAVMVMLLDAMVHPVTRYGAVHKKMSARVRVLCVTACACACYCACACAAAVRAMGERAG